MPNFHRLLVSSLATIESLDHLELKPKQLGGIAAVNVNEDLIHVMLAANEIVVHVAMHH